MTWHEAFKAAVRAGDYASAVAMLRAPHEPVSKLERSDQSKADFRPGNPSNLSIDKEQRRIVGDIKRSGFSASQDHALTAGGSDLATPRNVSVSA